MAKQRTIAKEIQLTGVGLHTGQDVNMKFVHRVLDNGKLHVPSVVKKLSNKLFYLKMIHKFLIRLSPNFKYSKISDIMI